jgi:hypothetical protein
MGQQRRNNLEKAPYGTPPYRVIEKRIGEELREHLKPPQDMPFTLLMLIMQADDEPAA